ncbi:MAG: S8 family serine peptidase [Gemmatimonadetes bacterium]|nr:S8 family serine peptidase [Gemmatimonadota bacterium]
MSGIRVAVVDSGITAGHEHVGDVAAGVSLVAGSADTIDRLGHGTAVAAAIREKAPNAELVPVKVFDRGLKTDGAMLAAAITWAAKHECRVINLSLGTANTEHAKVLSAAVATATYDGALVVAAYESTGTIWLPGSLPRVIGVVGSETLERSQVVVEPGAPETALRLRASIYPRPIPGVPRERNLHGVSFAVANVSGMLAQYLDEDGTCSGLRGFIAKLQAESQQPTPT